MDGTQPAQAVALQNALQGLGSAFVQLGNAILAIDAGKGAATSDAVAGGKGKKRKVKDKADKKPRPPSAYNNFVKAESQKLRQDGKTQQDVMRDLGLMWRGLSDHQKDKYKTAEAEAAADTDSDDDDVGSKRARNDSEEKKNKKDSSDDEAAPEKKEKEKKKKEKKKKKKKDTSSDSD